MVLQIRTKDGVLMGKILGACALKIYQQLKASAEVKTKTLYIGGIDTHCFVVNDYIKIGLMGVIEFHLGKDDYVKIL